MNLPIYDIIEEFKLKLIKNNNLVLVAPPGAGKTTYIPLVLKDEPWVEKQKIIVVEPRRIAARAAAARMASLLNEAVGEIVGLRVRFESKVTAKTRIEVVTEGVFTRMILDNPELPNVKCVIFDEFHERSLEADFGLSLALDCQGALREDLKIIVMSATLDGASVAKLLENAPIVHSEGRAHPITTHYLGRIQGLTIEEQMAIAVMKAIKEETGSILAFLPGQGEITRLSMKLKERGLAPNIDLVELYGAKDAKEQAAAIEPAKPNRRKIVLATSIAETSITIDGVRVVIDSGLSRVPRFEPDIGVTRLETIRSSRATNTQRQGRAGRVEAGVCYRLWEEREEGALQAFPTPEILSADLSPLVLNAAEWGVSDLNQLKWQDAPPAPAVKEAKLLLKALDAIDEAERITLTGQGLRALPLTPRLAKMVKAGEAMGFGAMAASLALILSEKGLGGDDISLVTRLENFEKRGGAAKSQATHMVREKGVWDLTKTGTLLLFAFPERFAKKRNGAEFTCANGRGCFMEAHLALAREDYIVVAEMAGKAQNTRILAAAPLFAADIETIVKSKETHTFFHEASGSLRARELTKIGAIVLKEAMIAVISSHENALLLAENLVRQGLLPLSKPQKSLLTRAGVADEALIEALASFEVLMITQDHISQAIDILIDFSTRAKIEAAYPAHFTAPTGNKFLIDYEGDEPKVAMRVTELYGLTQHPKVGDIPLVLELLSPAHKPVQKTKDIIGFWNGTYKDVRVEMKGRYPRHFWPENPMESEATARAKPRGT